MEELGLGFLGFEISALYSLTFKEFGNAVKGKNEREDMRERSSWERTRWQTAILLNVHVKKGSKISPKDLAVFPWEELAEKNKPKVDGFALLRAMAKKGNGQ